MNRTCEENEFFKETKITTKNEQILKKRITTEYANKRKKDSSEHKKTQQNRKFKIRKVHAMPETSYKKIKERKKKKKERYPNSGEIYDLLKKKLKKSNEKSKNKSKHKQKN